MRLVGVLLVTKLTQLVLRRRITDSQCGMRAYSRKALAQVVPNEDGMGASLEILFAAYRRGLRVEEVPTTVHYKGESDSSQNPVIHFTQLIYTLLRIGILKVHAKGYTHVPGSDPGSGQPGIIGTSDRGLLPPRILDKNTLSEPRSL